MLAPGTAHPENGDIAYPHFVLYVEEVEVNE
jgi:hypothetical protein